MRDSQRRDGAPPSLSGTAATTLSPTNGKEEESNALMEAIIAAERQKRKLLEWASWADSELAKCRTARHQFERQWYINLAFNAGKQYITPMTVAGNFRLSVPKAPPHRVRLVINKVRTAVKTECSKLTTSKPIPTVMPATNEDEDFSAAAVGEQILKTKFATASFESEYRSWIWWGVICGNAFLKVWWDENELDHDAKQLPQTPMFPGPDGQAMPIPQEIIETIPGLKERLNTPIPARGKICVERVTPFHIFVPDLLCETVEEQPYMFHVLTKSKQWVKSTYGIDANCDAQASSTVLDSANLITKGSDPHMDAVLVKEVWIKPKGHPDFPEGGMFTIINGKIVGQPATKWPYPFDSYPFHKYNGLPSGGFYSDSMIVDLIPLQKEYNKKRSQIIEIQNTMGKPKILYPIGSLNPKKISSEPGQSIGYTAGYEKPEVLPGTEVPATMVNEIEQLQGEFDDISGQHEISRGQTISASLTSGTAIAYLQEQDDAKLTYQVASIENAIEEMGSQYLILASHYWDDNRLIKTTGRNNTFEALKWKKGVLKGNTDVRVQTGSALPFSKAARQALVTEMMQNGFIMPETGLELMNFGVIDKAVEEALVDKRQAYRENLKMADIPEAMLKLLVEPAPGPGGEPPVDLGNGKSLNGDGTPFQPQPPIPVNSWDNHEEHIKWHNQYRKTQEYELLPELNKKAFELHVQMHQIAYSAVITGFGDNVIQEPANPDVQQGSEEEAPGGNVPPGAEPQ